MTCKNKVMRFINYLLGIYYVPDPGLGARATEMQKINSLFTWDIFSTCRHQSNQVTNKNFGIKHSYQVLDGTTGREGGKEL